MPPRCTEVSFQRAISSVEEEWRVLGPPEDGGSKDEPGEPSAVLTQEKINHASVCVCTTDSVYLLSWAGSVCL